MCMSMSCWPMPMCTALVIDIQAVHVQCIGPLGSRGHMHCKYVRVYSRTLRMRCVRI